MQSSFDRSAGTPISVVSDTRLAAEAEPAPLAGVYSEQAESGNVLPLLNEIRYAAQRWLAEGETTIIDIRRVPLSQKEEQEFEAVLGQGEVDAHLDVVGHTRVIESTIPGVWLVTHLNNDDEVMSKYVEVSDIPDILKSQRIDIERGLAALNEFFIAKSEELKLKSNPVSN